MLSFGRTMLDEAGKLQTVAFATLDPTWLNELAVHAQLPAGFTLGVINRDGTILAQYPDSERWAGQSVSDVPVVDVFLQAPWLFTSCSGSSLPVADSTGRHA